MVDATIHLSTPQPMCSTMIFSCLTDSTAIYRVALLSSTQVSENENNKHFSHVQAFEYLVPRYGTVWGGVEPLGGEALLEEAAGGRLCICIYSCPISTLFSVLSECRWRCDFTPYYSWLPAATSPSPLESLSGAVSSNKLPSVSYLWSWHFNTM